MEFTLRKWNTLSSIDVELILSMNGHELN